MSSEATLHANLLARNTLTYHTFFVYAVCCICAGVDTRFAEDNAQYESKQHLSNDLFEKAVSSSLKKYFWHYRIFVIMLLSQK